MEKKKRNNYLIILMLFVSTLIITFCLSGKGKHQGLDVSYTIGSPWAGNLVQAPFDFTMELDSATKKQVTDSVANAFVPVFHLDDQIGPDNVKALASDLAVKSSLSSTKRQAIVDAVDQIYDNGIVDNATYGRIAKGSLNSVRVYVNNDEVQMAPTAEMLSARAAYTMLDTSFVDADIIATIDTISIENYLQPNVISDADRNKEMLEDQTNEALLAASPPIVMQGSRIIGRGETVTEPIYKKLQTLEKRMREMGTTQAAVGLDLLGMFLFVGCFMGGFYFFMRLLRFKTFEDLKKMTFLIVSMTGFIVAVALVMAFRPAYVYLIPFALLPIIITAFCDTRIAFFVHLLVVLICSWTTNSAQEFIILQVTAGVIAILTVKELTRRSQLATCAFYIFIGYCIVYVALTAISAKELKELVAGRGDVYLKFAINGAVLSLAYLLIFVVEKICGFTSSVTLVEVSDINSPELRLLSEMCPGTFQHSVQVSNLSIEAARAINANMQLARAGALYHDIGKINNPAFFTENQVGVNPHDALTPDQSAFIVISHVTDGVKRAEKAKLPQAIIDFILQHHGKGQASYFYRMACKANPDVEIDPEPYTYPGPNPQTKEAAIVMMADSCEAACKSLKVPGATEISAMVEKIIRGQIDAGLLNESPISFREIGIVTEVLKKRLITLYRPRIEYPEEVKHKEAAPETPDATQTEATLTQDA